MKRLPHLRGLPEKSRYRLRLRFALYSTLLLSGVSAGAMQGCAPQQHASQSSKAPPRLIFSATVPKSTKFRNELTYLHQTGRLSEEVRAGFESEIRKTEARFGTPRGLLWCLLFQESRFDPLKNAGRTAGARGMGQFTQVALDEINTSPDRFYRGTRKTLEKLVHPASFPLTFAISTAQAAEADSDNPPGARPDRELAADEIAEGPPKSSYFNSVTAIGATGAYLNNRYRQLQAMLEREGIQYDKQVLWMFAAVAYNKGARSVYVLLSRQRNYGGDKGLSELLRNPKLAYALLTHEELLDISFRDLWPQAIRSRYLTEMTRNLTEIHSCAVDEPGTEQI